jgi:hypothetical protein
VAFQEATIEGLEPPIELQSDHTARHPDCWELRR